MAIGPVQLIVLGFSHPNFHGEIIQVALYGLCAYGSRANLEAA